MNPKRIFVALILALMVSGISTWLVARRLSAPAVQRIATVLYVAPSRALQAGELIRQDNTELVAWPATAPIEGAFGRTADVVGREILYPLAKGQPILDGQLSAAGSGTGLASRIPDGLRAVALRSDEVVGVAGFVVPGSHLDVLVTYQAGGTPEPLTATVLQDVVVLAAGHQVEPDPAGKTSDVAIVTLLLTPEQSKRAVLASSQGAIHFVLRNGGDSSVSGDPPIGLSQLATRLPSTAPAIAQRANKQVAVIQAPKRHEIEMVLGGSSGDGQSARIQGGGGGQ